MKKFKDLIMNKGVQNLTTGLIVVATVATNLCILNIWHNEPKLPDCLVDKK